MEGSVGFTVSRHLQHRSRFHQPHHNVERQASDGRSSEADYPLVV
jgi:hypothetical protein